MKKLQRQIKALENAPQKVINSTIGDMKKRVPSWIAAEVAQEYGIKKAEVTGQKVGKVKVQGSRLENIVITYTGRVLTPTHFSMSPTAPKAGSYTLKATIIKGQRSTMGKVKKLTKKQRTALGKNFRGEGTRSSDHSPIMLMHTGAKSAEGTQYIPFQRKSKNRSDVEAIKTISLPQMVSSERTAPNIQKAINENLEKRMDHYMGRYLGK
ncbi:Uncharacterised protein [uncultured Flavonifractor sp.]|nr:Uncharacterised protein [uncultured Flavonifractor sp.]